MLKTEEICSIDRVNNFFNRQSKYYVLYIDRVNMFCRQRLFVLKREEICFFVLLANS